MDQDSMILNISLNRIHMVSKFKNTFFLYLTYELECTCTKDLANNTRTH